MSEATLQIRSSFSGLHLRRRPFVTGGCALALAAIGLAAIRWWTAGRFMIETDDAYVRADVVTIAPRVAGEVTEVAVADNQQVRAGEILARIDDRDYRMRVAQAEGAVAAAQAGTAGQQARIATCQAQATLQLSVIAREAAAVAAREADAHFADLEYQRQASLSRESLGSAQNLQAAEAAARRAAAGLKEARAALGAARALVPVLATEQDAAAADLDKARGALQQTQALLEAARLDLQRTVIRAPVAGQVGQRSVRAGQLADVGTPLLALVPARTYVIANYKETQTDLIRPGQPVRIVVDALGGATLRGHVDGFAPASGAQFALLPPDNATGNFTKIVQRMPLRIVVDQGQPRAAGLRPGMSVETIVDTRPVRS